MRYLRLMPLHSGVDVAANQVSAKRVSFALSRHWALWTLPRRVTTLVVAIDAVAVALSVYALLNDSVTNADLLRFGLLVVLSLGYLEASRKMELQRRLIAGGSSHTDVSSVWTFAAALILPPSLAVVVAAATYSHLWARAWSRVDGVRPYRAGYSAAGVAITCFVVSTVLHHVRPQGVLAAPVLTAAALIALVAVVYRILNRGIVAVAIVLSGEASAPRELVGRLSDNILEASTLALGAVTAASVIRVPWFAVVLLPAVFMLQHHALINRLVEAATMDAKTALLNSSAWHHLAARELARAQRKGESAAVLIVDMDHFKRINDTHGHLAGDDALHAVGEALAAELRGYDAVGRFGGEEFVALLTDVDAEAAAGVAERVRRRIESLRIAGGGRHSTDLRVTASIGVALSPEHSDDLTELIWLADRALYVAKEAGRNAVRVAAAAPIAD
jgi:diguanylate cyclase (GGDEF)-like protein